MNVCSAHPFSANQNRYTLPMFVHKVSVIVPSVIDGTMIVCLSDQLNHTPGT